MRAFPATERLSCRAIASATTAMANHCSEFISSPNARTRILENNLIHRDMLYAAAQANLAFILNVVIDAQKKVIAAFAGDSEKAHVMGCDFLLNMSKVKKKSHRHRDYDERRLSW